MLAADFVLQLVREKRRYQPRIGGRKLYKLLQPDLDQLEKNIGRDKFFDILRENKLLVKRRKRYEKTTDSYHRFRKYKNKLKGRKPTRPNEAFVSDITYIRTRRRFVYLFLITDAYSRMIVGWHLSGSLGIEGALKALKMAIKQCRHPKGVIHHSDKGIQYCCKEYVQLLKKNRMEISMTEANHCYENAMAERVNGILKDEFLLSEEMPDFATTQKAVEQAIESYNTLRPHWSLNLNTPQAIHMAA
jgi:transposase InsO family protein